MKKIEQKIFDALKKDVSFTHAYLAPDKHTSAMKCALCDKDDMDVWLIRIWKPYQEPWRVWVCNKCYKGK